jgi:hypothetical protein
MYVCFFPFFPLSKAISSFANMLQQLENFMAWHGMHRGESKWSLQEDAAAAEDNACFQSLAQKDCQHLCVQVIERKQH